MTIVLYHLHKKTYRNAAFIFISLSILFWGFTFYIPSDTKILSLVKAKPSVNMFMVLDNETANRLPEIQAFLNSVLYYKSCHVDFHFLLSPNMRNILQSLSLSHDADYTFNYFDIPADVEEYIGMPVGFRNKATMLKVVPELFLPDHVKDVLIIDFDALVLHDICDSFTVFQAFSETEMYGAAPEFSPWYHSYPELGFSIPVDSPYRLPQYLGINAGVVFARLDKFRAQNWTSWWKHAITLKMEEANDTSILRLGDQDVWNYMAKLYPHIVRVLPNYWNRQVDELRERGLVKTYIAHGNVMMFQSETFLSTTWCYFAQVTTYQHVDCSARLTSKFIV